MVLTFVLLQCFIVKLLTKPILLRIWNIIKGEKFPSVTEEHFVCACARWEEYFVFGAICYFWTRSGGCLNGRSTFYERSYRERWKIITTLHTFLTLWISIVFAGTLDEDILIIKVRTERDKSPKEWSLEFDLTKIKIFTGEDKQWWLVSRCWSFIVKNHGVIYWDDRETRHPIWEENYEIELIFLQLWSKFSSYFRRPPSFKLLQTRLSLLLLLSH